MEWVFGGCLFFVFVAMCYRCYKREQDRKLLQKMEAEIFLAQHIQASNVLEEYDKARTN